MIRRELINKSVIIDGQDCKNFINKMKDFYFDCVKFIKKHKIFTALSVTIILLVYGVRLFWFNYGLDTDRMIYDYDGFLEQWIGEHRYGLVLLKKIFFPNGFNIFLESFLMVIALFTVTIILGVITEKIVSLKKDNKILLFIPLFFIASPLATEQLSFTLQSFECILGMILVILAIYFTYDHLKGGKNKLSLFLSPLFLIFSYTIYQSLVPFTIAIVGCILLLDIIKTEDKKFFWKAAVWFISMFLVCFVVVKVIPYGYSLYKLGNFSAAKSEYLDSMIDWGKKSRREVVGNIFSGIKDMFCKLPIKMDHYRTIALLIASIGIIVLILRNRRNRLEKILSVFVILFSSIALTILLGHIPVMRSEYPTYNFVVTSMIVVFLVGLNSRTIRIVAMVIFGAIAYYQITSAANLFYNDHLRFRADERLSLQIVQKFSDLAKGPYSDYNLVVIGNKGYNEIEFTMNYYPVVGDVNRSHFGMMEYACPSHSHWVIRQMRSMGYEFRSDGGELGSKCEIAEKKYLSILEEWPSKNSILLDEENKMMVVRF